ncbi:histidine ammonia-lyase [Bacteriovorax stolpii]|uniref:Histidine ammonia-lyase n=1 Tax=Bacteriovorax stolpii TaxID=960 RepID=A0A2K9NX62_BACTC|nr:histidine ammonia-lyase [Bacteriovorax stolpii]AUO00110.1 histidine ammonia-lyase [Bacteriovorax stolpii]QDK39899.1 histidine ammonia-lyase [Bacteriovorax stolpii]TDP53998.1 histidine ammonia-lyase [Bacteriovorax stolpii]
MNISLNGQSLTIDQVHQVAHAKGGAVKLSIDAKAMDKMKASRAFVFDIVKKGAPVYGINTGFGALSSMHIAEKDLATLQVNLIRSHCTGVGKPFSREVTRAIMLLRANCLTSGFSGVEPSTVELLLDFLNNDITPVVPEKGSVGASGDLAPLSHIALALIGEGEVEFQGKIVNSDVAIKSLGKNPAVLGPKDGLALINGTACMAALGALAVFEARQIMKLADICATLTMDGVKGTDKAYNPKITMLKPHPGQIACMENLNKLVLGSKLKDSHPDCHKVQDPYSLRCVPQVHGACRQTLIHAEQVIGLELNAVTDNPLIFVESAEVISGGNFHGEALALVMDYLAMGVAEICNISERRIEKMMNPTFSELPAFLTRNSGLNSGLMIAHVTAAALVSENKYLCHPASVDSVPTSTDKEDHVSMGVTAGRKLHEVIENAKSVLAIELLCNTQALDLQRPERTSDALEAVYSLIRKTVPTIEDDRIFYKDMNNIIKVINSGEVVAAAESKLGALN